MAFPLPAGIKSRIIDDVNGLSMHILDTGGESETQKQETKPLLLLLHGFPELSYSYRKIMVPLSKLHSGYRVVAPDQRGYGRTTGWDVEDLSSFRMLSLVTDIVALVNRLEYNRVECVIGHDFGSPVAAWCTLIRPDIFRSVVMMSAPFPGPPSFPPPGQGSFDPLSKLWDDLAALDPPRKHYAYYYAPPSKKANNDMLNAPQGLHKFLRAYFHTKSADWDENNPHPLSSWSADELAVMPEYYIMRADKAMAETVEPHLPDHEVPWLTDADLSVYVDEFSRTTFQGGLNWYQFVVSPQTELRVFANRKIDVPALFIAGEKDWGIYQTPGALQKMQKEICTKMAPAEEGVRVVKGAGHWVQQEQPEEVVRIVGDFISYLKSSC
ncbi:hypothetical protein M422DRAFT_224825 [Sphaerobolus stellatus SS14]|nr:hypothetical protein M422DRAFT_224825 [Sphaerobolus stellatus SS14]